MTDHTPGPWTFDPNLDPENEPVIWSPAGLDVATVETGAARDENQIVANARLIAAAPELLAVLESLWDAYTAPDGALGDEDMWLAVAAAIAKAKGNRSD